MHILSNIDFAGIITPETVNALLRALAYAIVGFIILRIAVAIVKRVTKGKTTEQGRMLITKGVNYTGLAVLLIVVLLELGVNLTPLLGAAGILGVAVGIASQTSLSNVISGLFLVSEKPFSVGDVIRVSGTTGIVLSIDLLSVKIRTFDNLFVRIPNQEIAGSAVTTITRFPIRRMDFSVSVAYKEDLGRVREILLGIAKDDPGCLDEPEPIILFLDFGDSGITLLFGVWFSKTDYIAVKNSVFEAIKRRFDEEGIEIPFPHRTLYTGAVTEPFPVRMTGDR